MQAINHARLPAAGGDTRRDARMVQEFTAQGKYFTEMVRKRELRVIIHTHSSRIEGVVHLHPDHRLLDELNQGTSPFMAITQATLRADGDQTRLAFMALRKDSIECIYPLEEQGEELP
jgi:hypothetical protein